MDLCSMACYLVLSVASHHFGDQNLNDSNPGVGVEVNQWHAGEYRNSLKRTSWYAGRDFETEGTVKAGVLLGAVTGYRRLAGSSVLPLAAPFVSVEYGRFGVNLALLPNPISWNQSALALQIKVKL